MPLNEAIYISSADVILATMGPYVCKYNADTGARIAAQKIMGPAQGPCRLVYHSATGLAYVAVWNSQVARYVDATPATERDLYPVTVSTLAIGSPIGMYEAIANFTYTAAFYEGIRSMFSAGSKIWFNFHGGGQSYIGRVDPTDVASFIVSQFATPNDFGCNHNYSAPDQICTDGTSVFYANPIGGPNIAGMLLSKAKVSPDKYCDITGGDIGLIMPCSVEYSAANAKLYAVCGDEWLMRVDDMTGGDLYDTFDLTAIAGACTPTRIRYCNQVGNPFYQKLLIPSQGTNNIVVWNPSTDTGALASGTYDAPLDVVFTPDKAFAVQSGPLGLKEITS